MSKLFFIHLMKTGGASFRAMLRTVVPPDRIYPSSEDEDLLMANIGIRNLSDLSAERRSRIDVYTGHFPFVATELVEDDVWTATILRDPIDRTVSFLKHCRRYDPKFEGWELERIYDDRMTFEMLIENYQVKMFAMSLEDPLESQLDPLEIDDERLAVAVDNLGAVDVVGLHGHYDDFVDAMRARTGWDFEPVARWRVGEPDEVSSDLRERIAADNEMDVRFFAASNDLFDDRRARR